MLAMDPRDVLIGPMRGAGHETGLVTGEIYGFLAGIGPNEIDLEACRREASLEAADRLPFGTVLKVDKSNEDSLH
jgi:hypothetical protein